MSTSPQSTGGRQDSLPGDRSSVALLTSSVVSGLTLAVAFGLLALGVESFWVAFVVGFGFVLPASMGVVSYLWADEDEETALGDRNGHSADTAGDETDRAMSELRMQYARGELSETEFERRVQVLTENTE